MSFGRVGAVTSPYSYDTKIRDVERVVSKPQEEQYTVPVLPIIEKEHNQTSLPVIENNSNDGKSERDKLFLQDFSLEELSLGFQPEKSKDIIGTQSDIRLLDMQKAISDMKKDQILEDYQYFVGSVRDTAPSQEPKQVTATENGTVIRKTK